MEDTATRDKSVTAFAKQLFSGRVKSSSVEKDIVDRQMKKRVESSDAKVHAPLTNTTSGTDQREKVIWKETDMTKKFNASRAEWSSYAITNTPLFVMNDTTMTTFLEADQFFSFAIEESVEVPEFEPSLIIENSLDLTYVSDLQNESVFSSELDSFFDLSALQNEQCFTDVKRTDV